MAALIALISLALRLESRDPFLEPRDRVVIVRVDGPFGLSVDFRRPAAHLARFPAVLDVLVQGGIDARQVAPMRFSEWCPTSTG